MLLLSLQFNFFHNIIFVGITIGFLLGLLLLTTPTFHKRANVFLATFLLSFSLNNLYYFFIDVHLNTSLPILNFLPISLKTLIPVAAYFYISYTLWPDNKLTVKHWLLFLPPVGQLVFYTSLTALYCFSSEMLTTNLDTFKKIFRLDELLSIVFTIILTTAIIKRMQTCKETKECSKEHLRWAKQFLLLGITAILLWIIPFLYLYFTENYQESAFYPMWSFSSVLICWIGVKGFKRPDFFRGTTLLPNSKKELQESPLTTEDHLLNNLREAMVIKKPYRDPNLSVKDLAILLGISINQLRKMVRIEKGNYNKFINSYRVEEAKKLLTNPQNAHFTIEAIGEMAGFRSRATFFSAFKQYTNRTPQQYKYENLRVQQSYESR